MTESSDVKKDGVYTVGDQEYAHFNGKTTTRDKKNRITVVYDAFSDVEYCGHCDEPKYSGCKCRFP